MILTNEEWKEALEASLYLQRHYATLLNAHDGGKRKTFKNAEEWWARLRELRRTDTLERGEEGE